jgi:hypothetical protein
MRSRGELTMNEEEKMLEHFEKINPFFKRPNKSLYGYKIEGHSKTEEIPEMKLIIKNAELFCPHCGVEF